MFDKYDRYERDREGLFLGIGFVFGTIAAATLYAWFVNEGAAANNQGFFAALTAVSTFASFIFFWCAYAEREVSYRNGESDRPPRRNQEE